MWDRVIKCWIVIHLDWFSGLTEYKSEYDECESNWLLKRSFTILCVQSYAYSFPPVTLLGYIWYIPLSRLQQTVWDWVIKCWIVIHLDWQSINQSMMNLNQPDCSKDHLPYSVYNHIAIAQIDLQIAFKFFLNGHLLKFTNQVRKGQKMTQIFVLLIFGVALLLSMLVFLLVLTDLLPAINEN